MGDVGVKVMLVSDGGWGYGHLLREVVPLMRLYGVTDEHVKALMVENPLRLLTITKEQ